MYFLTINDKIELEKVKEKDPIMSNSIDRLLYISSDEKITMQYEARLNEIKDEERRMNSSFSAGRNEGFEEGKLKGIKEGKLEGLKEGDFKTAKLLKKLGYDTNAIIKYTGLTEEEVNNID